MLLRLYPNWRAYSCKDACITVADSVPSNRAAQFAALLRLPFFNAYMDIETFEQLPLATGKTFAISYCDAGQNTVYFRLY